MIQLAAASDFCSMAYLFTMLRSGVEQIEELFNLGVYVCDMSAEIYYTPSDADVQRQENPVMKQRMGRPRLLSLATKPRALVAGRDLRDNPYFDPLDASLFESYTPAKKRSHQLAAFLISWILAIMGGGHIIRARNFYAYKREQLKKDKAYGHYKFWLYHVAGLCKR